MRHHAWMCLLGSIPALALLVGCASDPASGKVLMAGPDPAPPWPAAAASPVAAPSPPPGKAEPKAESGLPELNESSTVNDYVAYAAFNNPGLEAAFNRWKAALERIPQARTLSEPRLMYRYFILQMGTRQSIGIEQMFPWFGKLKLRGDQAAAAAEAERERWEAEKVKLVNTVKKAYYDYYYLSRSLAVTRDNYKILEYIEAVARARYAVAMTAQSDVIKAQVELGKLDDQMRTLTALREPTVARLNAALNRPTAAELPWPDSILEEPVQLTTPEVLALLDVANPELKAMDRETEQERIGLALAKKEYFPDFTLGAEYMDPTSQADAELSVLIGISLPVWRGKYRAMEDEALLRQRAAVSARLDRLNSLHAEAAMALFELQDAHRKIGLYRDTLIPKANESLKTTEQAYRAGTASFLDLLDALRVLLDFTLSYEQALANHAQRLAELEMVVGQSIPRVSPETPSTPAEPPAPSADQNPPQPQPQAPPPPLPAPQPETEAPQPQPEAPIPAPQTPENPQQ